LSEGEWSKLGLSYSQAEDAWRFGKLMSGFEKVRDLAAVEHMGTITALQVFISEMRRTAAGSHMENFFDCVRNRKEPLCPFDLGYRVSIACQMAIASGRQQRTVRWDPTTEEIVSVRGTR
jgi:hypothetical protein